MAENHPPAPTSDGGERPLAERLAAYAHGLTYEDLDDATIERVKTLLIDTIGCGVGAWYEKPVRICREIALAAAGPATVIGTQRRTATELAAFANAAAFRYLDFNDTYVGRFAVHPSDNIAACLAVAEAERASARELITAIVIAYEVNCRLVDVLDISTRGWDPPVFGLPAVALAAGRLMKLSPDQLAHAVSIAINDHIPMAQTRVGALSDWKGLRRRRGRAQRGVCSTAGASGLERPRTRFRRKLRFLRAGFGPGSGRCRILRAARRSIPAPQMQS